VDLDLKLHVLRQRHGARVATLATATFVANSVAELYVMQRYLQPERLAATGLGSFDAWAATFGRSVTALELAPEGGSYRMKARFARFVNVPELLTMFGAVADVRTAEELALPRPALVPRRWWWSAPRPWPATWPPSPSAPSGPALAPSRQGGRQPAGHHERRLRRRPRCAPGVAQPPASLARTSPAR